MCSKAGQNEAQVKHECPDLSRTSSAVIPGPSFYQKQMFHTTVYTLLLPEITMVTRHFNINPYRGSHSQYSRARRHRYGTYTTDWPTITIKRAYKAYKVLQKHEQQYIDAIKLYKLIKGPLRLLSTQDLTQYKDLLLNTINIAIR